MTSPADQLFTPLQLGAVRVPNRLIMAPLTRSRANQTHEIQPITGTYYAQRATAGLIISEATNVSQQGVGFAFTPGLWNDRQTDNWRQVVNQVHDAGGRIFSQLWHVGRSSHPDLQPGGGLPVAPSAVKPASQAFTLDGFVDCVEPRALETDELPGIVADYANAARNAKRAGFDGIEIHAANGYLLHQFLSDHSNRRTDAYGGSIENRARLVLEVVDAVIDIWGADRVGIRFSPNNEFGDMRHSDPLETYRYLIAEMNHRGLAYIHVLESLEGMAGTIENAIDIDALRSGFDGPWMVNGGYNRVRSIEAVTNGRADVIAIGRAFIANPDLVERFRIDAPLNRADPDTFYGGDERGYTDYPALEPVV